MVSALMMKGYSVREVASMLGIEATHVRSFASLLSPARGARGEYLFSFQDLILLRTAKGLREANVSQRRIRAALERLRAQLPEGRPLSGVHIGAEGNRIVVRDGGSRWHPESGQVLFDFSVGALKREVARLDARREDTLPQAHVPSANDPDALFSEAARVEDRDAERAFNLYHRVIELEPLHADALINLGRMYHERAQLENAITLYKRALDARPGDATAAFNLAVALEDRGDVTAAERAYRHTLTIEPLYADAHYNLARLFEARGERPAALRHFRSYRDLTQ